MTYEQLYIDEQLVDLNPNSQIALDIKSNIFRNIDDMTSNSTYSISLPKTAMNMRIFGNIDVVQDDGRKQYSTMPCRYIRKGVTIIDNGLANILSVDGSDIQICISWGACTALQSINEAEAKLTDIDNTDSIVWKTTQDKFVSSDELINKGYGYAQYNPIAIQDDTTSWQYNNEVGGEKVRIDYDATDGLIAISGTIGDVVSLTPDINYHSVQNVAFQVNGGEDIYLLQVYSVVDTYLYAFLDSSRKIIACSPKVTSGGIVNINITSPSNAAYFVANISVTTNDNSAIFRIADKNNDYVDGTTKPIVNIQHPVVTAEWLLTQVEKTYGIKVTFENVVNTALIKKLAIPLIKRTGSNDQKVGYFKGTFDATTLGELGIYIKSTTGIVQFASGAVKGLVISYSCKASIDIQASYTIPAPKRYNGTNNHGGGGFMAALFPNYIKVVITNADKSAKTEYLTIEEPDQQITISSKDVIDNEVTLKLRGWGSVELSKGDTITLELCNAQGNISQQHLQGQMTITATLSDNVVVGNDYPIVQNLPDIKIMDFLRTLLFITGTFPKQLSGKNEMILSSYSDIWDWHYKTRDWTKKLIPCTSSNLPRKMEYAVDSWAQKNEYRWKTDDKTIYNYDGELIIHNKTLDKERVVIELPFAASDENVVPMYVWASSEGTFGTEKRTTKTTLSYKGCEARLLMLSDDTTGKAKLTFCDELNLQNIIDTKYNKIRETLNEAKIITEYIALADLDIQEFDETASVYLAQYGAYFAVLEIKQSDADYCQVKLMKLNIYK